MSSLVGMKNVVPLLLQVFTFATVQVLSLYYLYQQTWFVPAPNNIVDPVIVCWENTVLFTVSSYQYVILATVYSKGKPYRQRLITNFMFLLSALSLTVFITWIMTYPCKEVAKIMDLMIVEDEDIEKRNFRFTLTLFPIVHCIMAFFIEVTLFFFVHFDIFRF